MKLRIMLVDADPQRMDLLMNTLQDAGHWVAMCGDETGNLCEHVHEIQPDVIIIGTDSPTRDTLEHLCMIDRDEPRPVVMFTHDNDTQKMRAAIRAGVSAYIIDGLTGSRVQSIIDIAIARFEEYQILKNELEKATITLAERKQIERAKGFVMNQRGCSEDEAYRLMRKMAMNSNKKLADIADNINTAADIFS